MPDPFISAPNSVRSPRRVLWLPLAAASLFLSIGCASNKPAYAKVGYDPEKLATPPHDLSAHDYPFDDDGTYRKDWVTDKNAKRPKKWFGKKQKAPDSSSPTMAMTQTPPPPTSAPPQSYRPPAPAPPPSVRPAPTPPPAPKARYHKVSKGDTLFGISRRYGVSVSKLKSTNGLSSDLIRVGQSLRIP